MLHPKLRTNEFGKNGKYWQKRKLSVPTGCNQSPSVSAASPWKIIVVIIVLRPFCLPTSEHLQSGDNGIRLDQVKTMIGRTDQVFMHYATPHTARISC
jgi:hypothetical protein